MQWQADQAGIRRYHLRLGAHLLLVCTAFAGLLAIRPALAPLSLLLGAALLLVDRTIAHETTRMLRGIRGERSGSVAQQIARLETEGFQLLSDPSKGEEGIEYILVGPTGVFVVETNVWKGRFYLRKDGWFTHSRKDAGEAVGAAARHVMGVRVRLRKAGLKPPVYGVVALTSSRLREGPIDMITVTFLEATDLRAYVLSRSMTLSPDQAADAAAAIARGSSGRSATPSNYATPNPRTAPAAPAGPFEEGVLRTARFQVSAPPSRLTH